MPDSNDPLAKLQRDIDEAKSHQGKERPVGTASGAEDREGMGQAMRYGVELVSGVAVGGFVGYVIDRWLATFPVFFIICFFLGAAGGFRNLLRELNKNR